MCEAVDKDGGERLLTEAVERMVPHEGGFAMKNIYRHRETVKAGIRETAPVHHRVVPEDAAE